LSTPATPAPKDIFNVQADNLLGRGDGIENEFGRIVANHEVYWLMRASVRWRGCEGTKPREDKSQKNPAPNTDSDSCH